MVPPVVPPSVTCRLHRVHARANPEQNINPYRGSASKLLADPVSKDFKTTSSLEDYPSRIHYLRRAPLVPWIPAALQYSSRYITYKACGRSVPKLLAPNKGIHDNGGKFIDRAVLDLLRCKMWRNVLRCRYCYTFNYGDHEWTVSKCLTAKRSLPPNTRNTRHDMSFNQTMQTSPGALVFQRNILFNIPVISDLEAVRNKRLTVHT